MLLALLQIVVRSVALKHVHQLALQLTPFVHGIEILIWAIVVLLRRVGRVLGVDDFPPSGNIFLNEDVCVY